MRDEYVEQSPHLERTGHTCPRCGGRLYVPIYAGFDGGYYCPFCDRGFDVDDVVRL